EEYYRHRAPEYEEIYYRKDAICQAELKIAADFLVRFVEGKTVLELACGTGYWTEIMSRSALSITASDMAPEMLTEARKKDYNCSVSFVDADMFEHSFGENCFDVVVLGFWFSHQPRQTYPALFDVIEKPLKRDGRIWMIDNNPSAERSPVLSKTDEHGNNYRQRNVSNGESYMILKNYFERTDLEAIFGSRFTIESLVHQQYYWSAVLSMKR
ncbi:MAG: class I SAM-dependent methyltransferase, partial [candidate division Zixibacteria bacterium]|nr:class I SAM-dependent methyltransferase [candidate division Zixibacteria bacterium]